MTEIKNKGEDHTKSMSSKPSSKVNILGVLAAIVIIGLFFLLGTMIGKNAKSTPASNKVLSVAKNNNNPKAPSVAPSAANTGQINIVPVDKDNDWIKGNKDAKVSVIEFSDTECPFCGKFHSTMEQVVADYKGKVNWVYRHFPISSLHSKAVREAEATECAGDQGGNEAFWAYTDRLFAITPANNRLLDSQLPEIAEYVGLDVKKFQACLDSGKYSQKIQDEIKAAQAAGAQGTPYSVIISGDQKVLIPGALSVEGVKALIDPLF